MPAITFLWKRRYWILAGVLIPTLAVLCMKLLSPRPYSAQLQYHWSLNSVGYEIFRSRFYGKPNLEQLTTMVKEAGLQDLAQEMEGWELQHFHEGVRISLLPSYIDYENKKNLRLSFERSWAENIQKLEELSAKLISIEVTTTDPEACEKWIQVLSENISQYLSLIQVSDALRGEIRKVNQRQMTIQNEQLALEHRLLDLNLSLENLPINAQTMPADLAIHIGEAAGSYLPLNLKKEHLQSQAAETKAHLQSNQTMGSWLTQKRQLLEQCLAHIESQENISLNDYRQWIQSQTQTTETPLQGEILSHISYLDTLAHDQKPLVDDPFVQPQARGTVMLTLLTAMTSLSLVLAGLGFLWAIAYLNEQK